MTQALPQTRPAAPTESRDSAVMVDVLVLSTDLLLFDAIRAAIGERNPVWRARSAEESVDLLLTGRCGVLLVDMAAVSGTPATLISQIAEQFPDLVIVVAGRREDEALLAQLISSGCVYRFMHKPITAKRAGMFLQAAVRRHAELRDATSRAPLIPLAAVLPGRFDPRKWLFVLAGVLIFVAILWFAGGTRHEATTAGEESADPAPSAATAPSRPLSDPVLSRARAAYAAGRYESPPGRNALDLYAAVLLSKPDQPEARDGLESTVARIAEAARAASARNDPAEAARLLARLQDVAPELPAVAALEAELLSPPVVAPVAVPSSTMAPMAPPQGDRPSRSSGIALSAGLPASASAAAPASVPATASYSSMRGTSGSGAALPGPVTRLPRETTEATAAKTEQPRIVRYDPLTPRYANSDELRLRELAMQQAAANLRGRRAAAPVAPASTATATASTAVRPDVAAPAGDELGRVRVVDPVYPAEARRDRIEGWVELDFTITETGSVRDVVVVGSQPSGVFDAAAIEALSGWKYLPRIANGRPVTHRSNVTMRFDLDN